MQLQISVVLHPTNIICKALFHLSLRRSEISFGFRAQAVVFSFFLHLFGMPISPVQTARSAKAKQTFFSPKYLRLTPVHSL